MINRQAVSKEKLLEMLGRILDFEQESNPLVEEKAIACLSELERSGLVEEDRKRMRRMLAELVADAKLRESALKHLKGRVAESDKSEF